MTFEQLEELKDTSEFLEDNDISEVDGHICIDGLIALPIITSYAYDKASPVKIRYPKSITIGEVKFLKNVYIEDINSLNESDRVCLLTDCNRESFDNLSHTFSKDYFLIKEANYKTYKKKFKKSSPIWGDFFHLDDVPSIAFNKKRVTASINLIKNIKVTNPYYFENLFHSINEPNPFNRFLKLYHLIELQFDLHTAEKIKVLLNQGNKEKEISSMLKEYSREEIKRLESILKERCTDHQSICSCLNEVSRFTPRAHKVFYEYGRESNPLKKANFNQILSQSDKFDKIVVEGLGYTYEILVPKVAAYWIYRIRSSIAHNKFGEYIMTSSDEDFIVEFAEPLLKEIVKQCFKG